MTAVRVVGGGLAGAATAHLLTAAGCSVEVVEGDATWGGQLRTASAAGILYEPAGAHIFHTADTEVWEFVTGLVGMRPYKHLVRTEVFGQTLSWPPQLSELQQLEQWPVIQHELELRPDQPRADNFETWCVDLMGETLYRAFIEGYTRKQWGTSPSELSATWAPKRIELRDDDYRFLFRSPHQGWPQGGYTGLVDALLKPVSVTLGQKVSVVDWDELCQGVDAVVLSCALDEFFAAELGPLPWRGVSLQSRYVPEAGHLLPCGVLNTPGPEVRYTRMIETKWMSGQTQPGTVVSYEYPGAPVRHYPVDDVLNANRQLQRRYEKELTALPGPPRYTVGRLATYTYIDMDQVIRQAMNTTRRILADVNGS